MTGFDADEFVHACLACLQESDPLAAVTEVVARAVSDPAALAAAFPVPIDPDDDGIIHRSADLYVTQVVFPKGFRTGVHDHTIPAVIGVWGGYEDNRVYPTRDGKLLEGRVHRVEPGQVLTLGADDAHDVHAPDGSWSAAVHVYLGDLLALDRGLWTSLDGERGRYDGDEQERRWTEAATATGLFQTR